MAGGRTSAASFLPLDALELKARHDLLVALVQIGEPVVDVELSAAMMECVEVIADRFPVSIADHGRVRNQVCAAFHVDESNRTREVEVEFLPVHQVEHSNIVLVEPQMFEALEQLGN